MKVKELIEALKTCDQDSPVWVHDWAEDHWQPVEVSGLWTLDKSGWRKFNGNEDSFVGGVMITLDIKPLLQAPT